MSTENKNQNLDFFSLVQSWGLPVLIFFLPWGARIIFSQTVLADQVIEPLTHSLYAIEFGVYFFIVLLLLPILFKRAPLLVSKAPALHRYKNLIFLLIAFVVWSFFSIIWSADWSLALQAAVRLLAAFLLLLLVLREQRINRIVTAFVLAALVQAALGVGQFILQDISSSTLLGVAAHAGGSGPAAVIEAVQGRLLRAYGTFPHPNILGGFLAVALVLVVAEKRKGLFTRLAIFGTPLITAGLMVSFSRSAWVAAFVGVTVVTISQIISKSALRQLVARLLLISLTVGIFVFSLQPFFFARVSAQGRLEARSVSERMLSITQAQVLIKNSPVIGVGIGNSVPALISQNAILFETPHVVLVVILLELGVIGFIIAAFVLVTFLRVRGWRESLSLALLLSLFVLALLDHYLWTTVPGLFIAATIWGFSIRKQQA